MTNLADCITRLKATVDDLAQNGTDRARIIEALVKVMLTTAAEKAAYEIVYLANVAHAVSHAFFSDEPKRRSKLKTAEHEIMDVITWADQQGFVNIAYALRHALICLRTEHSQPPKAKRRAVSQYG